VFTVHLFGRVLFKALEVWFLRLPVIRKIYPAVKEFTEFVFSATEERRTAFRRVVLVQYPRQGLYSLAFVTNESHMPAAGAARMLTILIPTPPNPFSGPVLFVPEQDVVSLDMSIEDAVKMMISVGVVAAPVRGAAPPKPLTQGA
jgi:uncharacterized membrane protein